jgi:prepilin-type N-terminal cleavage/methylation domain-containing protein
MKNNGFTLVELMVVLVILAILAAVAIPRFMGQSQSQDSYSDTPQTQYTNPQYSDQNSQQPTGTCTCTCTCCKK